MKKIFNFFLIILLLPIYFVNIDVHAEENLIPNARNGLLMEVSTGKIIYEKGMDEEVSIASLTKMMGLILIFEKIENGDIKYTDKVTASQNAADMGGSQIWLSAGEQLTVEEMLKGIIMASANDGIVAMAEHIGGTEAKFVEMMNNKAKELGLKHTNFVNPTGLDEEGHYSSAYDVAQIALELMKHDDVFKFTTIYEDYLRENTENKYWLVNTNKLIRTYSGADGLKTGMTDNAGYCMAVTAKRDGMRLLAVVLGENQGKVRNTETANLLDYGFNQYEVTTIKKDGEKVGEITLDKANPNKIDVILNEDVTILRKKGDTVKEYKSEVKLNNVKLPVKKGEVIGKLLVKDNNEIIKEIELTSNQDMVKKTFFEIYLNIIKSIFTGDLIN